MGNQDKDLPHYKIQNTIGSIESSCGGLNLVVIQKQVISYFPCVHNWTHRSTSQTWSAATACPSNYAIKTFQTKTTSLSVISKFLVNESPNLNFIKPKLHFRK